jgi:hypothetical protein
LTVVLKRKRGPRIGSFRNHASSWFRSHKPAFFMALLEPSFFLLFLTVYHWLSPQTNPLLFGSTASLVVLGVGLAAASAASLSLMVRPRFLQRGSPMTNLGLNVRAPTLPHRARPPGILELIAPFLKSSMWESQELAMVMHKSYGLMKKHVAYIRTLTWTDRYTSRPSNFMMSEAISIILKLLPPVEKHSATCAGCK